VRVGHGRGYYGGGQLAQRHSSSGGGWLTTAIVVAGLGAAAWFLWPRKKLAPGIAPGNESPAPSPPAPPSHDELLEQVARSRGFSSAKTFEDSVVATARELQASGARVDLGPHLQHLAPRLESP
jgi:hypothetical protein